MMRNLLLIVLLSGSFILRAQQDSSALNEIKQFQDALNTQYKTEGQSPLSEADRTMFIEHPFFEADMKFRVKAKFVLSKDEKEFKMKTSSQKLKDYIKYAELHFIIDGKPYKLNAYMSRALTKTEEYKDYLFIPFTDLTTGESTYGGGRYLDLRIPPGDSLILDFNLAYNPYCAYSTGYSCPIPPKENFLDLKVEAGIKYNDDH